MWGVGGDGALSWVQMEEKDRKMTPFEKIALVDEIGRELQSNMTFSDIYSYFQAHGIPTDHEPSYNSKYVYVKEVLAGIQEEIIIQIADEIGVDYSSFGITSKVKNLSANFWRVGYFRLFISHLSEFKKTVSGLKVELEKFGISGFVAHEDIEPTREWLTELTSGLNTMDALCAVLVPGFKDSEWTDQEIGVAIGRDVLIIPLIKGLNPYGLIGKYQGIPTTNLTIKEVAKKIFITLTKHEKTKRKMIDILIDLFLMSTNDEDAIHRINVLTQVERISDDQAERLYHSITENKSLKTRRIVFAFNDLINKYGYSNISFADFGKNVIYREDDMPF